jgi:protoporphyrinogen oxidase
MPLEMDAMRKKAIIIGAGPAGLTAAYELLMKTDILPVILEKSGDIGGISKTVNYKGNRMDIGGHRFFSKSDRVMQWWLNILPLEQDPGEPLTIQYQNKSRELDPRRFNTAAATGPAAKTMLVRNRLSRIYYLRKFFVYPIALSIDTIRKLGLSRVLRIGFSYLGARLRPRPERSLEDFLINRFGADLYRTFFKDYTEKVWGMPCSSISAEWGAQRIKGLSIGKALAHAIRQPFKKQASLAQKDTQTSLIDRFLYPRLGPGQLWEEVAHIIRQKGGEIHLHHDTKEIYTAGAQVQRIVATDTHTGVQHAFEGDYFFSTMPVKDLVAGMHPRAPQPVAAVAQGLQYRDFITVGLLLRRLKLQQEGEELIKDNWIYIQEKDVKIGRLQVFNNWSPYMVREPGTVWLGLEYFCNAGDELWQQTDTAFMAFAAGELEKIGIIDRADVLDSTIIRMEKTYPAYFGTYNSFDTVRNWLDAFENLFLIGRNGMHKYNNSDHSMLTAMVAVENILHNKKTKENIWAINTEDEYHEEK